MSYTFAFLYRGSDPKDFALVSNSMNRNFRPVHMHGRLGSISRVGSNPVCYLLSKIRCLKLFLEGFVVRFWYMNYDLEVQFLWTWVFWVQSPTCQVRNNNLGSIKHYFYRHLGGATT